MPLRSAAARLLDYTVAHFITELILAVSLESALT